MNKENQKAIMKLIKSLTNQNLIDNFISYEVVYGVYSEEDVLIDGISIFLEVAIDDEIETYETPLTDSFTKCLELLKRFIINSHECKGIIKNPNLPSRNKRNKRQEYETALNKAIEKEEYETASKLQKKLDTLKK